MINHKISVIGYGKDTNTGENYWSDHGFFHTAMDGDNLGITSDYIAGPPTHDKPNVEEVQFTQ